ncbi:MAG: 4-(cytidine 5'-diphospho)-2-C-methyl-D-erythritol kinase [Pseudomonadota bacterium]
MPSSCLNLPAPAKLNLFLHIIGRRADGYHNLQTVFQFLDYGDQLQFQLRDDEQITLTDPASGLANADNLVMKAACSLQQHLQQRGYNTPGVDIRLHKRLPQGAGLGGGSSDAATTLVGLNHLWQAPLSTVELQQLGLPLGADVPIFIHGHSAFAEGIGEQFTNVEPATPYYLVVKPNVSVATAELFQHPQLARDCQPLTAGHWQQAHTVNVFESVVCSLYPAVAKLRDRLLQYAPTRLTGSGACLFARFDCYQAAVDAQLHFNDLQNFIAQGQNRSSLIRTLTQH